MVGTNLSKLFFIIRKTSRTTGKGYTSFFLQFLTEINSIGDLDSEIGSILKEQVGWDKFKIKFMVHKIDQDEAKNSN